jgi:hypothetical protein
MRCGAIDGPRQSNHGVSCYPCTKTVVSTYKTEVSVVCNYLFPERHSDRTDPFLRGILLHCPWHWIRIRGSLFRGLTLGGPPFKCAPVAGQWRRRPAQTNSGTSQKGHPGVWLRSMKVHASSYRHTKAWPPSHDSRKLTSSIRPSIDDTCQCNILFPNTYMCVVRHRMTRPSMGVPCTTGVPGRPTARRTVGKSTTTKSLWQRRGVSSVKER